MVEKAVKLKSNLTLYLTHFPMQVASGTCSESGSALSHFFSFCHLIQWKLHRNYTQALHSTAVSVLVEGNAAKSLGRMPTESRL